MMDNIQKRADEIAEILCCAKDITSAMSEFDQVLFDASDETRELFKACDIYSHMMNFSMFMHRIIMVAEKEL